MQYEKDAYMVKAYFNFIYIYLREARMCNNRHQCVQRLLKYQCIFKGGGGVLLNKKRDDILLPVTFKSDKEYNMTYMVQCRPQLWRRGHSPRHSWPGS